MRIFLIMLLMLNLATAKKIALVIGNSDYKQGRLANPTKDADLIAQNLRDVGFSVTVKKNLSTALLVPKEYKINFSPRAEAPASVCTRGV